MDAFVNHSSVSRSPGKERDTETGLDYFGARYYGSNVGRWMSPDWTSEPSPIPYSDVSDPQSVNLYAYVRNSPITHADIDGHCIPLCVVQALESPAVQEALKKVAPVVGAYAGAAIGWAISQTETFNTVAKQIVAQTPDPEAGEAYNQVFQRSGQQQQGQGQADAQQQSGPKADEATGVSAGGQATDKYGNKLGGSRKPQLQETDSNTRETARNKALNGGSSAVNHNNPKKGKPHFHSGTANGKKKPNAPHHNYPRK